MRNTGRLMCKELFIVVIVSQASELSFENRAFSVLCWPQPCPNLPRVPEPLSRSLASNIHWCNVKKSRDSHFNAKSPISRSAAAERVVTPRRSVTAASRTRTSRQEEPSWTKNTVYLYSSYVYETICPATVKRF